MPLMTNSRLRSVTCALLIACGGSLPATGAEPAGAVKDLRGDVTAGTSTATRPLQSGAEVFVGETVSTGPGALVVLELGKRTTLKLGAETKIEIDSYLADAGGEIDLMGGAILFERKGTRAANPLNIKSPYGLIAVRGTRFYAGPSKGKFGVLVGHGRVEVTAAGKTVSVGPQEGTDIGAPGEPPSDPALWKLPRIEAMKNLFK